MSAYSRVLYSSLFNIISFIYDIAPINQSNLGIFLHMCNTYIIIAHSFQLPSFPMIYIILFNIFTSASPSLFSFSLLLLPPPPPPLLLLLLPRLPFLRVLLPFFLFYSFFTKNDNIFSQNISTPYRVVLHRLRISKVSIFTSSDPTTSVLSSCSGCGMSLVHWWRLAFVLLLYLH